MSVSAKQQTAGIASVWWMFVVVAVIMTISLLLLACLVYCTRYSGETYPGAYDTISVVTSVRKGKLVAGRGHHHAEN